MRKRGRSQLGRKHGPRGKKKATQKLARREARRDSRRRQTEATEHENAQRDAVTRQRIEERERYSGSASGSESSGQENEEETPYQRLVQLLGGRTASSENALRNGKYGTRKKLGMEPEDAAKGTLQEHMNADSDLGLPGTECADPTASELPVSDHASSSEEDSEGEDGDFDTLDENDAEPEAEDIDRDFPQTKEAIKVLAAEHKLLEHELTPQIAKQLGEYNTSIQWGTAHKLAGSLQCQPSSACEGLPHPADLVPFSTLEDLGLAPRLLANLQASRLAGRTKINEGGRERSEKRPLRPSPGLFAAAVASYSDVLYSVDGSREDKRQVRNVYVLWVLSHLARAKARVLRNSAKRKGSGLDARLDGEKDQGFTKPRALILLPMRNFAYDVVSKLTTFALPVDGQKKAQVTNKRRFKEEFFLEETGEVTGAAARDPDFRETFRGNTDDDFKLGIQIGRNNVRLYSDFYSSDVIVASPLGLRRILQERPGEAGKDPDEDAPMGSRGGQKSLLPKSTASDFLSSIEICVVDGTGVLSMQNWEHLQFVLERMNLVPTGTHDTDFSRLRPYFLEGWMPHYRQTVFISEYLSPRLLAQMRKCSNHLGKYMITELHEKGSIARVLTQTRQVFNYVEGVSSPVESALKRFSYFQQSVLPKLRSSVDGRTLIFVPSYFDFVRIRNLFMKLRKESEGFSFAGICEYTKSSDVIRARSRFFHAQVGFLVMTERFYYFYRAQIRGAKTVVFYGVPENAKFYADVVNTLVEMGGEAGSVLALYDQFDVLALQRIVGDTRAKTMTKKNAKRVYMLY